MTKRPNSAIRDTGTTALFQAAVLSICLAVANPHLGGLARIELSVAMLWVAIVMNGAFSIALILVWNVLRYGGLQPHFRAFHISGLVAAHLTWALLNRLTLTQTWLRPPRFFTLPGLLQTAALGLMAVSIILAAVSWTSPRWRRRSPVMLVLAIALAAGSLLWNANSEVFGRTYSMEAIRTAIPRNSVPAAAEQGPGENVPVIELALDGVSWSILKPLLEAGKLPNFARLIEHGAIGYLDNGNVSLSPVIWNTIFTGRSAEEHGIRGFSKLTLPRSGQTVTDFLPMSPSLHTFYGLKHLVESLPSAGLWRMELTGSVDRKAKTVWDVASEFGKRVAVANPLCSLPVQPVNGSMIIYTDGGGAATAFPASVATQWRDMLQRTGAPRWVWWRRSPIPNEMIRRTNIEAQFTLRLFSSRPFDLGVYYSKLADEMSHLRWDFYGKNELLLTDLPNSLTTEEWEQLVRGHVDEPIFQSYIALDADIGALLGKYRANYIVVSDHGWTYSGYEHYGSPDGIVIFSGPAFRSGVNLSGTRIEDVTPTILSLLGVPLSRELRGRPVLAALKPLSRLTFVDSYGSPRQSRAADSKAEQQEELRRLKSLGYVQ